MNGFSVAALTPTIDKFAFLQSKFSPPKSAAEIIISSYQKRAAAYEPPIVQAVRLSSRLLAMSGGSYERTGQMVGGVTVALQAMGAALTISAGPIGIIAAAVAALAAGILMLNAASKKIHQERIDKYGLNSREELDSTYIIAQKILVERNTAVNEREQILANLRYQYETGDDSAATRGAISRQELWLKENSRLNEDQALEIAAAQVRASRPEEDDPIEGQMNKLIELMNAQNGLLGDIDDNTAAASVKNLRWNKMGVEDFYETMRLGV